MRKIFVSFVTAALLVLSCGLTPVYADNTTELIPPRPTTSEDMRMWVRWRLYLAGFNFERQPMWSSPWDESTRAALQAWQSSPLNTRGVRLSAEDLSGNISWTVWDALMAMDLSSFRWGAVAVAPDGSYGSATGRTHRTDADIAALEECGLRSNTYLECRVLSAGSLNGSSQQRWLSVAICDEPIGNVLVTAGTEAELLRSIGQFRVNCDLPVVVEASGERDTSSIQH